MPRISNTKPYNQDLSKNNRPENVTLTPSSQIANGSLKLGKLSSVKINYSIIE